MNELSGFECNREHDGREKAYWFDTYSKFESHMQHYHWEIWYMHRRGG